MRCAKCFRPLRLPSPDGYGPVCRKAVAPISDGGRDLFGFDIERAAEGAMFRLELRIDTMAADARRAVRARFQLARERLGVAL